MEATRSAGPVPEPSNLPAADLMFWIITIMATTVGETAAAVLKTRFDFGLMGSTSILSVLLLAALAGQVRSRSHEPWMYWITVVLVGTAGSLMADELTRGWGLSLPSAMAVLCAALGAAFAVWYAGKKTLSSHAIFTTKGQLLYWTVVLLSFALGTAAEDMVAEGLKFGYVDAALLFGGGIVLVALCFYRFRLNAVTAFWLACILARPFGASMGELLSQRTGLDLLRVSALFVAVGAGLIVCASVAQRAAVDRIHRANAQESPM